MAAGVAMPFCMAMTDAPLDKTMRCSGDHTCAVLDDRQGAPGALQRPVAKRSICIDKQTDDTMCAFFYNNDDRLQLIRRGLLMMVAFSKANIGSAILYQQTLLVPLMRPGRTSKRFERLAR
jgi:hypothetical protein